MSLKNYSKEQIERLIIKFNNMTFDDKLITIRNNPTIFELYDDSGWFLLDVKGVDPDDFDQWFAFDGEWQKSTDNLRTVLRLILQTEIQK